MRRLAPAARRALPAYRLPAGRLLAGRPPASALLASTLLASVLLASARPPAPLAAAARQRASLTALERQVMCATCKIPLDEAQSAQAERERAFIGALIGEGRSSSQIKRALVAQYGPAVLALPGAHGFELAVYVVPVAVVLALLALLAALLPSWRRRARADRARSQRTPRLSPADAARLEADLADFD